MRAYGKLSPTFWTRGTGKSLRGDAEAQVVAMYLMSAPTSNMIGLYYLPISTISHDTGLSLEGASKALRRVSEGGLCTYDEAFETVFVHTMAPRQLSLEEGEELSPKDNRVKAIVKMMKECGSPSLLQKFYETHREELSLPEPWWQGPSKPLRSPLEGPSKPGSGSGSGSGAGAGAGAGECERGKKVEPSPPPPTEPTVADAPAPSKIDSVDKGTIPEPLSAPKRKARNEAMPEGWKPKDSHKAKAKELGLNLSAEAEAFADFHLARNNKFADWDRAFHTWLRNATKYGPAVKTDAQESGEYIEVPEDSGPIMSLAEALEFCPPEHRKPIQEFLGGIH